MSNSHISYSKSGKGVFGMSSICMTFVPLRSLTTEANAIQKELFESIEAGIAANKYSPVLQKQFKVQLDHIRRNKPSCELVLTQTLTSKPSMTFFANIDIILFTLFKNYQSLEKSTSLWHACWTTPYLVALL